LQVDVASIRQLDPPQPDFCCSIDEVERRFELVSITDPVIEKKFSTGKFHYSNFKIEIKDLIACIAKKSNKTYSAGPKVELVVHEAMTPIDALWLYNKSDLDRSVRSELMQSQFDQIWVVDFSWSRYKKYSRK
jgi:hypothetical protein